MPNQIILLQQELSKLKSEHAEEMRKKDEEIDCLEHYKELCHIAACRDCDVEKPLAGPCPSCGERDRGYRKFIDPSLECRKKDAEISSLKEENERLRNELAKHKPTPEPERLAREGLTGC